MREYEKFKKESLLSILLIFFLTIFVFISLFFLEHGKIRWDVIAIVIVVMLLFMVLGLAIGYFFRRRINSEKDYDKFKKRFFIFNIVVDIAFFIILIGILLYLLFFNEELEIDFSALIIIAILFFFLIGHIYRMIKNNRLSIKRKA